MKNIELHFHKINLHENLLLVKAIFISFDKLSIPLKGHLGEVEWGFSSIGTVFVISSSDTAF